MKCALLLILVALRSLCAAQQPKPIGQMVDLGEHRLHVNCTGKGRPTVVVETGLGDFSFGWVLVQSKVEKLTRICTYDRAGYAWSDPGPKPRTFAQINLELHELGEDGPFVVVGHSYGGLVVRNFALTYPHDVAGMVLVETIQEDQRIEMGKKAARIRDSAKGTPVPPPHENMLPSDKPNLPPWPPVPANAKVEPPFDLLPSKDQQLQLWAEVSPALNDAEDSQKMWSAEYLEKWHASTQEGSLGTMPLIVMTRANGDFSTNLDVPADQLESDRKRLQAELAKLSRNGKQLIVASGHNMQLEAPEAVTRAIQSVVEECRQQGKASH